MKQPNKNKWWEGAADFYGDFMQTPELSGIVVERAIKAAAEGNAGEYEMLSDAAQEAARWIAALRAIDQHGNPHQLLKLLQRQVPPPIFPHLVDLLERKLKKPRGGSKPRKSGRPRTPSYLRRIEGAEVALRIGLAHVKYLTERDMPLTDALAKVAQLQNIPLDLLTNAQAQRRGASRQRKSSASK